MKKNGKQSIKSGKSSVNIQVGRDLIFSHADYPVELVDQKIEEEVDTLRKSRFYVEFDLVSATLRLGELLVETEFSHGTRSVRSRALAWCARFLSFAEEQDKAEEYLTNAKNLGACPEIAIASAFLSSRRDGKNVALDTLAESGSPSSRAAALMIVVKHDGAEEGLDWLRKAGIKATNLDADGKCFLTTQQLQLGLWEEAKKNLSALSADDFEETPALHHISAMTLLLSTVPADFRSVVLNQLPLNTADFPLASGAASMIARQKAQHQFADAKVAANELNCPKSALKFDEYELWLELQDPERSDNGKRRLEAKLHDLKSALHLVPLGLHFGIKLDLGAVEQEIKWQIALHGKVTEGTAAARLALAFIQKTPKAVADYIVQHYNELSEFFDQIWLGCLQIELLSLAGLPERANECFKTLQADGLSGAQENRLRRIIAEAEGIDPIEARTEQYKQTGLLIDLVPLVDKLEKRKDWVALCEYGALLFEETHSVIDAERFVVALSNTSKTDQVIQFFRENPDFLLQSKTLRMSYVWALYHEGALVEALAELKNLSDIPTSSNLRVLQVNLGIALGDWGYLSAFVANEFRERERRSAQDLIKAAQLALHLNLPDAKGLIFATASKCDDDAAILAAIYFLASSTNWGDDEEVVNWLLKAAELSGEDGPIQRMTFKDILDRKPAWDRLESDTWKRLRHGEIPMFLAAQSLNKSLIYLMLFPAYANLLESDPRRRGVIPAFSGNRQPGQLDIAGLKVGIDATALLTLSFLNLLDKALDAIGTIHVPHSTLAWLFEEKQKAVFHQPARIQRAHQLRGLIAREALERLVPGTTADSDLSVQVGEVLALLIAEAERTIENDDTQRIVVRSSPVHRVSSLMEDEADLTSHVTVMSSCLAVVEKLRQKGQLTTKEHNKARAYLQLHEKPWPNQPEIADGAVLFLDDLAVSYLQHLGLLERLRSAGFKPVISPERVAEADALIAYERLSDKIGEAIEYIRSNINTRIESGVIKVSRQRIDNDPDEQSVSQHPTFSVIALASECDAVISDERFLNKHARVDDGTAQSPIFSTVDLLDALVSVGVISADDLLESRTLLRRAGYIFVPLTDDELAQHLNASMVEKGEVNETAELKAIRENVLQVRMSDWLQLPKEVHWLYETLKVFIRVAKSLWKDGVDLSDAEARANWIVDQIDIRGWAHRLGSEQVDNIRISRGLHVLMLLLPPPDAEQEVRDAFWSWVETRILIPIKDEFPDLYAWLVDYQKKQIAELVEMDITVEESV